MADPAQPPSDGGPAADPSMEDILASIRRILNEDEAPAAPEPSVPVVSHPAPVAAPAAPPAVVPAEEPAPDILDLTEDMLVSAPPPPPAPVAPPEAPPPVAPASDHEGLLGAAATAAAAASVGHLIRAVSADRSAYVNRGGPSIEDVVREEMRPLLKDWLDAHLPGLVERLVRAEIERVVARALD